MSTLCRRSPPCLATFAASCSSRSTSCSRRSRTPLRPAAARARRACAARSARTARRAATRASPGRTSAMSALDARVRDRGRGLPFACDAPECKFDLPARASDPPDRECSERDREGSDLIEEPASVLKLRRLARRRPAKLLARLLSLPSNIRGWRWTKVVEAETYSHAQITNRTNRMRKFLRKRV
jgi:hypothetical protein